MLIDKVTHQYVTKKYTPQKCLAGFQTDPWIRGRTEYSPRSPEAAGVTARPQPSAVERRQAMLTRLRPGVSRPIRWLEKDGKQRAGA